MLIPQWNTEKIKQCESEIGQALLSDEQSLVFFSQDFGKLITSPPAALCVPDSVATLQALIRFAAEHKLPLTIRGNGLSQSGQSLAVAGGLVLSMAHFNKVLDMDDEGIWVEANASWSDLLEQSLSQSKAPAVLPYNCNLSIAGVLSAAGVGASSFKYGTINAHVAALEVVDGCGVLHQVDTSSPLFHACLSGQGQFAVITKARIQLKKVQEQIKTFCFVYSDQEQWFRDLELLKKKADYIESFCSPSIQGARLEGIKRVPMAQWLYGLHCSIAYSDVEPHCDELLSDINPLQLIHSQTESISSYLLRHDSRFEIMKMLGQWDLFHPWYECFVSTAVLKELLPTLLAELPLFYANLLHVVPVAQQKANWLQTPKEDMCSIMILNPGIPAPLKEGCIKAINDLDQRLLKSGAKRYLSGFLGYELSKSYWQSHFGEHYEAWLDLKKIHDPMTVFNSVLYKNII